MTADEKLARLKLLYSGNESDEILAAYLDLAAQAVIKRAYPYRADVTEVPVIYESDQLLITVYLLNKQGAEGETSHNENGISRSYESGSIPDSMLRSIVPYGEVIGEIT
jgi:hypothetical protein